MTQDAQDAIAYGLQLLAKVEEVRMPEWTDTYGRKWKIEIKKKNEKEQNIIRKGGRNR